MNAEQVLALLGRPRGVIAIDGPSGAGKSTYARRLAGELAAAGHPAALVATDFYATWHDPVSWWPTMLVEVIEPLLTGHPAYPRPLIWPPEPGETEPGEIAWPEPTPGPEVRIEAAPILLIEGVSSARRSFAHRIDVALWCGGGTPSQRLELAVARDGEQAREPLRRWQEFERGWFAVDRTRERCLPVDATG